MMPESDDGRMTGPASAGSNPLYDRQRESKRTTINGVPTHVMGGHLPPPIDCPYCGYPCFELDDPDAQNGLAVDGAPAPHGRLVMRAEFSLVCVDPAKRAASAPFCGHPYHLRSHDECRPGRLAQAFPAGLIARPPR